MSKKLLIAVVVVAVSLSLSQGASANGRHRHNPPVPEKVTICHVNRWDAANPYTMQSVNLAQYLVHYFVDYRHFVPTSEAEANQLIADNDYWGDIMPEFRGYLGRNLTSGQAILDNDCQYTVGGSGGGPDVTDPTDPVDPITPTDPADPVVVAQVETPTRALVAAGGSKPVKALAGLVGLVASIGALGYGITKLRKV